MNLKAIELLVLLLAFDYCFAQEPREKKCVDGYELNFFYGNSLRKRHREAIKACKNYEDSRLVKVDNPNITAAIDSMIKTDVTIFYIDGTPDEKRNWTWSDGSKIYLRDEAGGYQNWGYNQPNNLGGNEDCITVGRGSKKWLDSICRERLGYICQKDRDPCITVDSSIPNIHECVATGSKLPQVEWRKDNTSVTISSNQGVYQTKEFNTATLYFENATIGDTGEYFCAAWIFANDTEKISKPEKIKVNGTPSITSIKSFLCNSSLLVSWKPNQRAIGFPHRVIAFSSINVVNLSVTPTEEAKVTEITGLQPNTKYIIQISACEKKSYCADTHIISKNATTRGTNKTVTNVILEQLDENNKCVVTWNWSDDIQENANETFMVKLQSVSESNEIRIVETSHGKYSYSFEPHQNLSYIVSVQSMESLTSCGEVQAVGFCIGEDIFLQEGATSSRDWTLILIILPTVGVLLLILAVIGLILWKRKRAGRSQSTETTTTVPSSPPEGTVAADTTYENSAGYCNVHEYAKIETATAHYEVPLSKVDTVYQNVIQQDATSSVYEN